MGNQIYNGVVGSLFLGPWRPFFGVVLPNAIKEIERRHAAVVNFSKFLGGVGATPRQNFSKFLGVGAFSHCVGFDAIQRRRKQYQHDQKLTLSLFISG
jgi:hypothetical protein